MVESSIDEISLYNFDRGFFEVDIVNRYFTNVGGCKLLVVISTLSKFKRRCDYIQSQRRDVSRCEFAQAVRIDANTHLCELSEKFAHRAL